MGTQDLVTKRLCSPAGRMDQRRLSRPDSTLDRQQTAAAAQQRFNGRNLAFALEQLRHGTNPEFLREEAS